MTEDTAPILEMTGITKSFTAVKALENVDFRLRAGEVHALLGENGAGKSTLLKVLTGVMHVDAGKIVLKGEPVHFREPARGAARRHQRRVPGSQPLPEPVRRGEHVHRPRASATGPHPVAGDAAARHRSSRARRRPRRCVGARVHALARRAADGGNRAGNRHLGRCADPRRADVEPRPRRGGAAVRRDPSARGEWDRRGLRVALPRAGLRDRRPRDRAAERTVRRRVEGGRAQPRRARDEHARPRAHDAGGARTQAAYPAASARADDSCPRGQSGREEEGYCTVRSRTPSRRGRGPRGAARVRENGGGATHLRCRPRRLRPVHGQRARGHDPEPAGRDCEGGRVLPRESQNGRADRGSHSAGEHRARAPGGTRVDPLDPAEAPGRARRALDSCPGHPGRRAPSSRCGHSAVGTSRRCCWRAG